MPADTPPLHTGPAPASGDPPQAVDLAAPAQIQDTRYAVADAIGALQLADLGDEDRRGAGRPLSAQELRFCRAVVRFLDRRGDVGEAAGVPAATFHTQLERELGLARLGRVAGELEALGAAGEIIAGARLTADNDRVLLGVAGEGVDPAERERLRTFLASADLIYEREVQLIQGRRDRAALRARRQAAELSETRDEAERLRRRGGLLEATKREEAP